MQRRLTWIVLITCLLGSVPAGMSIVHRREAEREFAQAVQEAKDSVTTLAAERAKVQHLETVVSSGTTFSEMLSEMDFPPATVYQTTEAARKVFNMRRLRPGNKLSVIRGPDSSLVWLKYRIDPEHELWVMPDPHTDGNPLQATIHETPGTTNTFTVAGQVKGSLFDGIIDAGERPELALRLAEIFAFDIDFNTDTRPNDTFRLVLEKKSFTDGSEPSYGRIFAAEYVNGGDKHQAVLFHDPQGQPGYYSADGKSLQKAFLRSPLPFAARISSHFSLHRFHPVLKITRPHLGTDYAAPTGTPVQAIAGGRVEFAGRKGGNGNFIRLAHSNGYETYYLHLSRILVRTGQHVQQGQRIGLVGMTGLASGPHLDFRMRKNGQFVNFERLKLPPAFPVAKADMGDFLAERDHWMGMLNEDKGIVASNQPTTP